MSSSSQDTNRAVSEPFAESFGTESVNCRAVTARIPIDRKPRVRGYAGGRTGGELEKSSRYDHVGGAEIGC